MELYKELKQELKSETAKTLEKMEMYRRSGELIQLINDRINKSDDPI